jgi:plastocyanin
MKVSYVLLAVLAMGCGGGGGDSSYTTSPNPTPNPGGSGATASATVSITASSDSYGYSTFSFSPSTVTITKGGTVTWNNDAGVAHNVTFMTSGSPTNIGNFSSGSNSRTFDTAGTYSYHCTNHAGMDGTVKVQ